MQLNTYVLYNQREYDKAIQAFDRAIELDPKLALAWNNKGLAFLYLGENDKAIQAFDKVIELDPKLALAWSTKGLALAALGRPAEAEEASAKARELVHIN